MGSVDAAGVAAGPNALRGSGPNRLPALEGAMTQAGSPDPRNDRICITSSCPRHVWTAPWQELSDVSAALVGCGHVSGLFVRHVAAGPNALRGSGPNQKHAL